MKDQIISLFMLFKILSPKGIFICEELDFPETRKDMNINNEYPDLKNILNEFPKMETAWCNLGFAYLKYGNINEAQECFNNSISLNPGHIQTLLNLASLHLLLDEKEKVVKYLNRVLDIQPKHLKARNLLNQING